MSLCSRPLRTSSGLSILISCMETLATRFARLCKSCWSFGKDATLNAGSGSATGSGSGIVAAGSGAGGSSSTSSTSSTSATGASAGMSRAGAGSATVTPTARTSAESSSRESSRSRRCMALVMKAERTDRLAERDAAVDCARSIAGRVFVGRVEEHAETKSAKACCMSSSVRWSGGKLSRTARETASSRARSRAFCASLIRRGCPPTRLWKRAQKVSTRIAQAGSFPTISHLAAPTDRKRNQRPAWNSTSLSSESATVPW